MFSVLKEDDGYGCYDYWIGKTGVEKISKFVFVRAAY